LLVGALVGDVRSRGRTRSVTEGKQAAGIEGSGGPIRILTLVEDLGGNIRPGLVRVDGKSALHRDFIAIAPGDLIFGPIETGTVAVGKKGE
jgi:hypothetical protein